MKALVPTLFGLLMVVAATAGTTPIALVGAAAAAIAVLISVRVPMAATGAVLLTVCTVLLAQPAPMYTALSGLAAAAYLVLRHNRGRVSVPAMIAAVGFTGLATLVVAAPVELPWVPLVAPIALFVAYVLALRPFLRDD
ncbi:hypothetical protein [Mycobacterium sp. SMC-4]|uniref:hypothetical protein n=1 Tax=Mycobacterium sp. SMC-4 TaxID=2857059 RepID=UPI003D07047A